jgi:hypothetical protein
LIITQRGTATPEAYDRLVERAHENGQVQELLESIATILERFQKNALEKAAQMAGI